MNRFEILALVAVIVVTPLCATAIASTIEMYVVDGGLAGTALTIGIAGWILANYGAVAVAVGFWRVAKRSRLRWLLHLIALPLAVKTLDLGETMMLSVVPDLDFDGVIGAPLFPGSILLVVVLIGYPAAIIASLILPASPAEQVEESGEGAR
jgi:hypothetical protein